MRDLPVVECPHIIVVIPAHGRCRCGLDRSWPSLSSSYPWFWRCPCGRNRRT